MLKVGARTALLYGIPPVNAMHSENCRICMGMRFASSNTVFSLWRVSIQIDLLFKEFKGAVMFIPLLDKISQAKASHYNAKKVVK